MRQRLSCLLLVFALLGGGGPATADVIDVARGAIERLDTARQQLAVAKTAQNRIIAMTEAIRAYDVALLAMRSGLRNLRQAAEAAETEYQERRDRVERLLGGMQAVSRAPKPLTFVHPGGPLGAARAGMTMRDLLPAMNAEARRFREEAERLATLAALQEVAEADIREALDSLRTARLDLKTAVFEDRRIKGVLRDDTVRIARLARNSSDLKELVQGLALLPSPPDPADAPEMELIKGNIPWPADGSVIRRFREADAAGIVRRGIVMATHPLAIVSAPVTARVRYTGRFLDHGLVVILEPEPGYMLILAGLAQVSVVAGEGVIAGRPVGLMGGALPEDEDFLIPWDDEAGNIRRESLYIELRRRGIAINPQPWFRPLGPLAGRER